ncbi:hypothetical protein HHI36_015455 [Cryptolaemus montrouzieri]|uniref:Far11/STRP C-terminal domain-containing protein n=1 Tax=Cryptolaemus montrouzieri TaxID=559131 RepID=A0ABD2N5M4_9CUCU
MYSLKLLKIISKHSGRKWRQDNMKIMNKIFQIVRHRLLDDWNNEISNYQDESILKEHLNSFNKQYLDDTEEEGCVQLPDSSFELTEEFKNHYEIWLEEQLYQMPFNWDSLLISENIL